jgi:CelD/BcsL family acetyltransferase involved in cellulose biosynthesis
MTNQLDRALMQREDEHGIAAQASRAMATGGHALPFQSSAWLDAFAHGFNVEIRMLTLRERDATCTLPLTISRLGPFRVADIAGAKHASFHAPIISGEISAGALRDGLLAEAKNLGLDALTITDSPQHIDGAPNPLLGLGHQPSPSFSAELSIKETPDALMLRLLDQNNRKKLRQKEKKLSESYGALRSEFASSDSEIAAALAALQHWKAIRFGAKGIDDPFASAEAQRFLEFATAGPVPSVRLFTLHAGERLIAVMAGAMNERRFSGMANAHDPDHAVMKSSPGDLLIASLVQRLAADGVRAFDLGVGEARYKSRWCPDVLPLVDCALPISAKGRIAVALFFALRRAKRVVKQNPMLMGLVARLRALRAN